MRESSQLTAKQEHTIVALLETGSITDAANRAGVSTRSIHKWLRNDDAFKLAYRAARRETVSHAIARLQQLSSGAAFVLASIMADRTVAPSVRVQAASKLLDLALRAVEIEDLEERITALEALYKERT